MNDPSKKKDYKQALLVTQPRVLNGNNFYTVIGLFAKFVIKIQIYALVQKQELKQKKLRKKLTKKKKSKRTLLKILIILKK